jgi:4'-phosphopantetheinyl transferase
MSKCPGAASAKDREFKVSEPLHWSRPPARLLLTNAEVQVWRADLRPDDGTLLRLEGVLSADERERAARFVFPEHRQRYVVARGILRHLLGRYLSVPPAGLAFAYGPKDKPSLAIPAPPLTFNVSHSHSVAVFAISSGRELGVDIESIRPDFATIEIAERYFSPGEISELQSLPPDARARGFFLCWTRKEAYVKARGEGLGIPLHSFDVTLTPEMPAVLRSSDSGRWTLRSFQPGPTFAGAIVGEGQGWELRLWDWTPEDFFSGQ